jgi:LAS superfamily LD-carboxypeptidase LdcB
LGVVARVGWSALVVLALLDSLVGAGRAAEADTVAGRAADCPAPAMVELAARLRPGVAPDAVFGLPIGEAAWVLYPVTQERALPAGYEPSDLINTAAGGSAPQGARPMRRLIVPDLQALFAAARADGVTLGVLSGYRSYATQATLFDSGARQQRARGAADDAEAEARANRFRARPGHSQHQLGTTLDLTSPEVGNGLGQRFGESRAGRWVAAHVWEYGFVLPYTELGEPRTGYVAEPWHIRWVGRELAALLAADNYLDRAEPVADDYLVALDALLTGELAACTGN